MRLQLLLPVIAAAVIPLSHTQENFIKSGNYQIRHCGAVSTGSKTDTLLALLPYFWDRLQLVLADVRQGVHSKAFRAFFKTQENVPLVERVFKQMADGHPVRIQRQLEDPNLPPYEYPSLICLDPSLPGYNWRKFKCERGEAFGHPGGVQVQLCPSYWNLTRKSSTTQCPQVRRNRFTDDEDWEIMYNQFGVFVHEMAHVYAAAWEPELDKTLDINEYVRLSPKISTRTAQTYALYAASKPPSPIYHLA